MLHSQVFGCSLLLHTSKTRNLLPEKDANASLVHSCATLQTVRNLLLSGRQNNSSKRTEMTHTTTARVLMGVKKSDRTSLPLASHDIQSGVWKTSPDLRGLLRPNAIIVCKDHSALRFLVYLWFLKSSKVERVTFSHQAPLFWRKFSVRVREADTLCTYKISLKPSPLRDIIISHYRATTIIIGNLMLRGKTLIHHVLSSAHS